LAAIPSSITADTRIAITPGIAPVRSIKFAEIHQTSTSEIISRGAKSSHPIRVSEEKKKEFSSCIKKGGLQDLLVDVFHH